MTDRTYLQLNQHPASPNPHKEDVYPETLLSQSQPWLLACMHSRQRRRNVRDYC